jgi:glycosyltransferase involved in cell wall biosynthesis
MRKSIYFIVPYPRGEAPSQRFRFEQYIDFLEENGFEIHFFPFLSEKTWKTLYQEGKFFQKGMGILRSFLNRFALLFSLHRADFIFIHREASHIGPPIFEWFIAKVLRRKFIYDFDDAIWLPNYSESNAKFHRLKAYWKVNYCMKWAHQVTAGNAYLANYAKQFNSCVQVIPTTIDTLNHHTVMTNHEAERVTIGWTGTHTTMHYLDELVPVLQQLEQQYDFTFLVISNQAASYPLKSLRSIPWNKATEIEDLAKINIGVMPLKKDIWSEGKCGFKGLQYMALEIPTIMSPVGVNTTIVADGVNGFLVETPEEWYAVLESMLLDKQLRLQIGKAGKKRIDEAYSVKANQNNYLKLFQ